MIVESLCDFDSWSGAGVSCPGQQQLETQARHCKNVLTRSNEHNKRIKNSLPTVVAQRQQFAVKSNTTH
jgi:hypothetical protein